MFLFSNPHPHSVHQGMFLSRNTKGQESLFWPIMEEAGLLPIAKENRSPEILSPGFVWIWIMEDHLNLFFTAIMLFQPIIHRISEKYLEKNISSCTLNRKQQLNLIR